MALVEDYFAKTSEWQKEYGENTVVLMQVGAFFEVYGVMEPDGTLTGSRLADVSQICDLAIANKSSPSGANAKSTKMAGFRDIQLDKYLNRLNEAGWTVVVYVQDAPAKNTTRSLDGIYSPGSYFSDDSNKFTNNTLCVWAEEYASNSRVSISVRGKSAFGLAVTDIYTGRTGMLSFVTDGRHNPSSYDELERIVSIYNPSEVIFISTFDDVRCKEIAQFTGISSERIKFINLDDKAKTESGVGSGAGAGSRSKKSSQLTLLQKAKNAEKQSFQLETLTRMFPDVNDVEALLYDYQSDIHSLNAFTFLMSYLLSHNPNLTTKISLPESIARPSRLVLANHSLKQLNIIGNGNGNGNDASSNNSIIGATSASSSSSSSLVAGSRKLSSVSSLLNSAITASGRRAFQDNLLNPSADKEMLQAHYNMTEVLLNTTLWEEMRHELRHIRDIEKLNRKMILGRATPRDLSTLTTSLESVVCLTKRIANEEAETAAEDCSQLIPKYLAKQDVKPIDFVEDLVKYLKDNIKTDEASGVDTLNFAAYSAECANKGSCFIKEGFSEELNEACISGIKWQERIEAVRAFLNNLICKTETKAKAKNDLVKLYETATMAPTLVTTKRRGAILELELAKISKKTPVFKMLTSSGAEFDLDLDQIKLQPASSKSDSVIVSPEIKTTLDNLRNNKDMLNETLTHTFKQFCACMREYSSKIVAVAEYVRAIDLLQSRCYIATKYGYCKPVIAQGSKRSFVQASGLRHPLIEHIQTNELYVTNDISLGKETEPRGMLLFGTNAVGKTSLIKSLGIAVIMAQAGLYVACSDFVYSPYTSIFTRILGNDNLHRGLSTFAVEMIELRTILKLADENSLILGDELCSGTESDSALSIFAAGVEHLHETESSFIFATHFHEIVGFDEIKDLDHVCTKHLTVEYDKSRDVLVYDRKLKDGPGDRMYGLEVCKALDLPTAFLERAHALRNKYNGGCEDVLEGKSSHFNVKRVMGACELCNAQGTEVHHLQHQKNADGRNRIKHFHKNHVANLVTLCSECHDTFHETDTQYSRKKTSSGYKLYPLEAEA